MQIGIFDSGLGGLVVAHSLIAAMPQFDYVYFGDMAHVPYGDRPQEEIYEFTREGVTFLFEQGCQLIVLACNSASADALRKLQQDYLPEHYPERRILGVLVPAAEEAVKASNRRVGIIATQATVESNAYVKEIQKRRPDMQVFQQAAPKLVPLIEAGEFGGITAAVEEYIAPLLQKNVDSIVLGCTHYPVIKDAIKQLAPGVRIISQDEIIPASLSQYLERHREIDEQLSRGGTKIFYVSKSSYISDYLATKLFGERVDLQQVDLH